MASQVEPSPVDTSGSATQSDALDAEIDVANTVYDDDDDEDDDAKSETSTVYHEHECFETFQHKVAELVASKLNPDNKSIRIERMKGGSYNRVVGVEIHASKPGRSCFAWAQEYIRSTLRKPAPAASKNYVFRTSRNDGADMEDQIAILKAVGARLQLPVPEVVHYDLSSDNVVGRPFMIQSVSLGAP
jgi:hypothetical protein